MTVKVYCRLKGVVMLFFLTFTTGFSVPTAGHFIVEKLSASLVASKHKRVTNDRVKRVSLFAATDEAASLVNTNNAKKANRDSIESFAQDIATVLNTLRAKKTDPTICKPFRNEALPSFTNTWSLDDWDRHTSRWRYVDYIISFPVDRLLVRSAPQVIVVTVWSAFAAWLCTSGRLIVNLPLTTLSLISTFVAALISLRSNQGLSRLTEGRNAFGKVVLYTRDMAQLITSNIYPKDPELALKLLRHVSLFGWLLKNFLRGEKANGTDEDIIRAMLDPADAEYVLRQRKKPVAVVTRLRQVFYHMAEEGLLNTAEELALDHMTHELNHCITTTERIRASPIPPLYTAHTGRLLLFYLFFLPFALSGGVLGRLGTVLTTTAAAYTMLGLEEISHLLEQPFKLMPLYHLSKNAMRDVADAIVCQPPSLDDGFTPEPFVTPPYW